MVAHRVNLKFAPELRFELDRTFAAHDAIDALLKSPRVARDLAPRRRGRGRSVSEDVEAESPAARAAPATIPPPAARRGQRLDQSRQAGRRHLDPGGGAAEAPVQRQEGRATPARSTRSLPACCRSRSARRPRRCPSSRTAPRPIEFAVRWGVETDTDDAEGKVVATSDARPDAGARSTRRCRASSASSCRRRRPSRRSSIAGERAYDLARDGEAFEIAPRADRRPSPRAGRRRARRGACSRPNAARAPMCARSRATSAGRSAATAMSSCCAALRVGPFHVERGDRLEQLEASPEARAAALLPRRGGACRNAARRRRPQRRGDPAARPEAAAARRGAAGRGARPMRAASARRSRSARSRTAISSRRGSSTCQLVSVPHFHAASASRAILSPSAPFSNVSLAMRSSLSCIGKSNQPRLAIRSTFLRELGVAAVEADQEVIVGDLHPHARQRILRRGIVAAHHAAGRCP